MYGTPRIRPAAEEDAPAIAALLGELGYPTNPGQAGARLAGLTGSEDVVLVADAGAGPVGVASVHLIPLLHQDGRLARITAFVVSVRARRMGVGSALLRACEGWALERGAERMEITSSEARDAAHAFYASRGYARESVRFTKRNAPARCARR